jgi:hypothetical protein
MKSREELEARVEELEKGLAAVQVRAAPGVRKSASWGLGNLPVYSIALGPDPERGEARGHAKGIFALGDVATGFLAVGGWARGVIALGGLATGLLSFGGLSVGALAAVGGLAIGSLAFGGGAVGVVAIGGGAAGGVAIGGAAAGHYACGGGTFGDHVINAREHDPTAEAFFREHHLEGLCPVEPLHRVRPELESGGR